MLATDPSASAAVAVNVIPVAKLTAEAEEAKEIVLNNILVIKEALYNCTLIENQHIRIGKTMKVPSKQMVMGRNAVDSIKCPLILKWSRDLKKKIKQNQKSI